MTQLAKLLWGPRLTPGLALFALLLGCYLLTMSGHTYTSDEETMLAVAERLVDAGSFALEPDFLMNYAAGGADGQRYSRYGPGQSLAIIPFLLAGRLVATGAPEFASGLVMRLFVLVLPALLTAATAVVLFAWARALGYRQPIALLVGLGYGLASLAWPYSRTLFAEPTATLLVVLAAYALRRATPGWWAVAGAAAGAALAVKVQVALVLPLLVGYALLVVWPEDLYASRGALLRRFGAGLAGAALPLLLLLAYNAHVFGQPLTTGYGSLDPTSELGVAWQEGLYGLLVSPGKGLLLFSPVVLVGLVGLGVRRAQQGREALLAVGMLLVHLAFFSRLNYWHGDGSWGPRYLLLVVPFLLLPAAGLLATIATWRSDRARMAGGLVGALALVSLLVQLLPVVVNFNTYIQLSDQSARFFVPTVSPLAGHMRLWGDRLAEWWLRAVPPVGQGVVVLRDGFSYSEGDRAAGELLPRWTYAAAQMQVYPYAAPGPLEVRLVVGDHRPWPLERARFGLLRDGQPASAVERIDLTGDAILWDMRTRVSLAAAAADPVLLTLQSDTWNPTRDTEDNPRNEDLGLQVVELDITQGGERLALREALPIPSPRADRRTLWLWYYDTPHHHLLDVWLWYVLVAGLPPGTSVLLVGLIGLPGLWAFGAGLRGVLTTMRAAPQRAAQATGQASGSATEDRR